MTLNSSKCETVLHENQGKHSNIDTKVKIYNKNCEIVKFNKLFGI